MTIRSHKQVSLSGGKSAGAPSDEQLTAIGAYTLAPLTAEQVYVRTAYLAHNGIDRDREAFNDKLLSDFARTLPGKGLFLKHPGGWDGDSGPGVGRWFDARVVTMTLDEARAALREPSLQWPPEVKKAALLEASFYIPRTGKNADLIADIDAGVAGDVSIGFRATSRAPIENEKGEYLASLLMAPGEALEGSLVWLGAQPGARVAKSAKTTEDNHVDLEQLREQVKTLEGEKASALDKVRAMEQKAGAFDALKSAVGDLVDKPDALKAAVTEAKAYRDDLVEKAVAARRVLGLTADGEADVNAAKGFYAGMSIDMLKAEVDAMSKRAYGKGRVEGTDPARSTSATEKPDGEKDFANPMDNPLLRK